MSKTLIQTARDNGDLMALWDFRGGNLTDQSGNGITLTVPSDAQLSREGLRVHSASASFPLDMSAVQNFGVFALIKGLQAGAAIQTIAELTTDYTAVNDGWALYEDTSSPRRFYGAYRSGGATTSAYAVYNERSDHVFVAAHIDRRLSYESVKPYQFGILDQTGTTDNNTNDGSGFADNTVTLMGRGASSNINAALLQVFGIIDFTSNQWSATQQALLYSQIRNRETI